MDFQDFPKMARLSREIIVTEKIDGTNAQICIAPGRPDNPLAVAAWFDGATGTHMVMCAGSRSRWITPADDNFGFAAWVQANAEELSSLGEGRHFGEWWGQGIQRKYGQDRKRFSLFNVSRWADARPACCDVVPVLWRGNFDTDAIETTLAKLAVDGSVAAPGFMKPEGIVVFHTAANSGFKKTIEKDEVPKSMAAKGNG